jgi:hypothetical protein
MVTLRSPASGEPLRWAPSVFYVETLVKAALQHAWCVVLDYQNWNPNFVGAQVSRTRGEPGAEGEVVRIQCLGADGKPLPEFHAETVRVVPRANIVWWVYREGKDGFRNFVDFGLQEQVSGVSFKISYYAQNLLSDAPLLQYRRESAASLERVAAAFKSHCEKGLLRV